MSGNDPDILTRLEDLHRQATTENSHFYTANCIGDAMREIIVLRRQRDSFIKLAREVDPELS